MNLAAEEVQSMALAVGKPYPETPPASDSIALTFQMVDTPQKVGGATVMSWEPVYKMWLEGPEWEQQALDNDCLACGMYTSGS